MTRRIEALALLSSLVIGIATDGCVYDWSVGHGDGGSASSSGNTSGNTSGKSSSVTTSVTSSASTGVDCGNLVGQYKAALLSAKQCVMTDPTGCQLADTDGCGCKVFLDHTSAEATAFDAKKAELGASGCSLGCTTCPVGPTIGSCAVDLAHGGTSCIP